MLTLSVRNRIKPKRAPRPKIDDLLESVGLIRHVVPKDGNSLFRCISHCVFLTQSYHMIVRQHLLTFSNLQTQEFYLMTQIPVSMYERKITNSKLDGELLDMRIAAKVYKINIAFYVDEDPFSPLIIETPNSIKTLNICLNSEGSYDLVLLKETVVNISFCQAIIYKMLYDKVFKLSEVDFAVKEMLFDRNLPSLRLNDRNSLEKRATCTNMKELLEIGITPFPFKVAKALTPKYYRNTEYDIWLNNKRDKLYGIWNNWEFKVGSKCMVKIGKQDYHCYIQCIRSKNEAIEVYVKDLAQKVCVSFDQLKLLPIEENMMDIPLQVSQRSSTIDHGSGYIYQVFEQHENFDQYHNQSFIYRSTVPEVLPGQMFSPYYVQYQQQNPMSITSLDSTNNENMHPWYISTPPPILQNDFHLLKDQTVLFEPTIINKNCIPSPILPPQNLIDNTSLKFNGPHLQPMSWYCNLESNTSHILTQSDNNEESNVILDSNYVYQPVPMPENESQ